ncbi:putative signal recognition particle [Xylona heveae TC161]|uniref:Signal recognition particle subunit SRP68 n=1 Tax=Xylona heveae (strain CBS 132557 / TC161) TaxID=1328760 RepID=A0A165HEZ9_XYLHT|nr:putative signal recognition particle [Xylona heveae TC161]KZF23412.1 putative signal recognition particle [Xylona heveae TC161]
MDITHFVTSRRDNALLVGDYNSYRAQLSRRLQTVTKKLGRSSLKGKKYTPKTPITAEDIAGNYEFVHLLLLASERAWAHAMHMKSVHSQDTTGKGITGTTRRHIISRLQKAANHANTLSQLLDDRQTSHATDTDVLEARAYFSSLSGAVEFEKQNWEASLRYFSVARVIYQALEVSTKKDMYRDILSGTIDPSIRYAAYQLRLPRTVAIPVIAQRYFPTSEPELVALVEKLQPQSLSSKSGEQEGAADSADGTPKSITWRSRTVDLEDASIAQALAAVAAAERKLSAFLSSPSATEIPAKEKATAFDDVLIASQDAVDATKSAIDELASEGVGQGDKRMQALQITRTAVNYSLVGSRIGRNRELSGKHDGALLESDELKKKRKPRKDGAEWVEKEEGTGKKLARLREHVVLYDLTLQSIDSIKDLPGIAADASLVEELDAKRAYFQALKCLSIAHSHSLLSNRENALALFLRAAELAEHAHSSLSTTSPPAEPPANALPSLTIYASQSNWLKTHVHNLVSQNRALVFLYQQLASSDNSSPEAPSSLKTPLIDRLDAYPTTVDFDHLVTYPPRVQPVPVKPLFFDVAWNYIDYPGRSAKPAPVAAAAPAAAAPVAEHKPEVQEQKPAKRGWFGFGR